jgi:hypothetical protein
VSLSSPQALEIAVFETVLRFFPLLLLGLVSYLTVVVLPPSVRDWSASIFAWARVMGRQMHCATHCVHDLDRFIPHGRSQKFHRKIRGCSLQFALEHSHRGHQST